MFMMKDGAVVEVSEHFVEEQTSTLPERPQEDDPIDRDPRLIDFGQWIDCFTLNNSNGLFAEYMHWWNGVPHEVNLRCGESGKWGYKHIREDHESQWQERLETARNHGWSSEGQGIESWDDLMAATTAWSVLWPEYKGGNAQRNTSCGVTEAFFARADTGQVVYSFRVAAVWANDSDRLITSYPRIPETC